MSRRELKSRRATLESFGGETLVVCPRCRGRALSRRLDSSREDLFAPRRMICAACGHSAEWAKREIHRAEPDAARDDYFGLALWLQTRCVGHVLWAYNREHLELIEKFVRAKLRERVKDAGTGWSNRSLTSRLPRWIKAAGRRDEVLRAVERLRASLGD